MSNIRTVVFDLGHVLVDLDFSRFHRLLLDSIPDLPDTAVAIGELIRYREFERGTLSNEEFLGHISGLTGGRATTAEIAAAWCDIFLPHVKMLELRDCLLENYQVLYLSNTNGLHAPVLLRDYQLAEKSAGYIFSHEVKSAKPEPEIYQHLAQRFLLAPQQTVFIDDLADNITTARNEMGWQAIHHTSTAETIMQLQALGVII
ncbi:MAG: HAD family phosphatase [bacterium]|nr:HAD family phosphatase [bacterium]